MGFGSINGNPAPSRGGGIEMGQMGEGGGSEFYMGQGQQEEEQEEEQRQDPRRRNQHPDLVLANPAEESSENENRQFIESLIGEDRWADPWEVPATERSPEALHKDKMVVRSSGRRRYDSSRKRMFIVNA